MPSVGGSPEDSEDDGHSDVEDMQHPILGEVDAGFEEILASPATRAAFTSLDSVNLMEVFTKRARVLKSPTRFLGRSFQVLHEDGTAGSRARSCRTQRGQECPCVENCSFSSHDWCCIVLLVEASSPRRFCRSGFHRFARGVWLQLLAAGEEAAESRVRGSRRIRSNFSESVERRAERDQQLANLGELSSARLALEGSALAPGNLATLRSLTNPARRPARPREPMPQSVADHLATGVFSLDSEGFLQNLRVSKKGAAGGLSGMTVEHLRPLLERPADAELLCSLGQELAEASTPSSMVDVLRRGRITTLQKPDGGVRGIVVGEVFRRLVARTMAQQLSSAVEEATAPFQYALSTRAGCECIAHAVQAMTDVDGRATILSIDGIGAFDLVSRGAMLEGLRTMEGGGDALPFVMQFYGSPSTYLWEDEEGVNHEIPQGEGGEQGDPLMPALFALGLHQALLAVQANLLPSERLLAFLDDIYVVCSPERVSDVHASLQHELWRHSRIEVHQGKTQLWNRGGVMPSGCEAMTITARAQDENAIVWRWDHELPPVQQGVKLLGTSSWSCCLRGRPIGEVVCIAQRVV